MIQPQAVTAQQAHRSHCHHSAAPPQAGNQQANFSTQPALLNQQVVQLLIQLLQVLLQNIQSPNNPPTTPQQPKELPLRQDQQEAIKSLLFGLDKNAPFTVQVLDNDGDGQFSTNDTAILSGGITGGEVQRKNLGSNDFDRLLIDVLNSPAPVGPVQGLPVAYTENNNKWQNAILTEGLQRVSYTTQQSCFCPTDFTRPMNITENFGQITAASYADTGEPVPQNVLDSLQPIGGRWAQLQNAYQSGAERIDVTYDPQYGYPNSVFIDQSAMIADEEIQFTISNLRPA